MSDKPGHLTLRPVELVALAAIVAVFIGGTVLLVTRDIPFALIVFGGSFIIDLVVLAMLMLAITPNRPTDGERTPDTPHD